MTEIIVVFCLIVICFIAWRYYKLSIDIIEINHNLTGLKQLQEKEVSLLANHQPSEAAIKILEAKVNDLEDFRTKQQFKDRASGRG